MFNEGIKVRFDELLFDTHNPRLGEWFDIADKGEEISQQEMLDLINSSGSGDNPSDTTTIITNEDGTITVLFTSDKDSLDAIISQSSAKAESKQTDDAILKLVDDGQLTQEEAEAIAGERRNFADKKEETT